MNNQSGPPAERSSLWQQVNQAAGEGLFKLQVCSSCDVVQYPPQEFCHHCLTSTLLWRQVSPLGAVLSWTTIHAGTNRFFKDILPLHTGMIKLDCGPVLIAYLAAESLHTGSRVRITNKPDKSGQVVFFAASPDTDPAVEFSELLEE